MPKDVKQVNFQPALPLRLRDWRALKGLGVTPETLSDKVDLEVYAAFITYVAKKADPEVTADDVDNLTLVEMSEVMRKINVREREIDRPT
jgi:hypothetical protein